MKALFAISCFVLLAVQMTHTLGQYSDDDRLPGEETINLLKAMIQTSSDERDANIEAGFSFQFSAECGSRATNRVRESLSRYLARIFPGKQLTLSCGGPVTVEPSCSPACKNGGKCSTTNTCTCAAYFFGKQCQYGNVPFHRYFNGRDHFYTVHGREIGTLAVGSVGKYGYKYEGVQARIYKTRVPGSVPLFRYYNSFDHFYTTNAAEIGTTRPGTVGRYGYRAEGVAGFCFKRSNGKKDGNVALHRGYGKGEHFYSTSKAEVIRGGFGYEGIQCFVGQR